jgi:hypothetical protein
MPVLACGECDAIECAYWVVENVLPGRGVNRSPAVANARKLLAQRPGLTAEDVRALRKALMAAS